MSLTRSLATALSLCLIVSRLSAGQTTDSIPPPLKYAASVQSKMQRVDGALTKATSQYLNKLSTLENSIKSKLRKLHPGAGTSLSPSVYDQWASKVLHAPGGSSAASPGSPAMNPAGAKSYVASLDTMSTSLHFLRNQAGSSVATARLAQAGNTASELQSHFDESSLANQYIQQKNQELSGLLQQYSHLPPGIANEFNKFKETAYYYKQQVQAYKAMLSDPSKIEATAMGVLQKSSAYQQFLAHHSMLAGMFPGSGSSPEAPSTVPSLPGLQTRSQVQAIVQQQTAAAGSGAQGYLQQQADAAQSKLNSLKQQIDKYGASGTGMDLPDNFKPNSQKTKTLLQRLEYGVNVQLIQSTSYFPATANFGVSLGYKINQNNSVGVGLAYTAGMGTGWEHIQFSNQALGLRSYVDLKIKKSYYFTGGYEENYMIQFKNIAELREVDAWQPSLLMGLEKKYKLSGKMQGNVQILFDALYKTQNPQGQPIKFRVGYSF